MEMGKTPHAGGARRVARRSASPILSMTLSLAAVFIPVLFMGGIIGRLFHEFAVTIMVAILISGFVSLSLTPDAVQPLPAARRASRHNAVLSRLRAGVRRHARRLRLDAARRHAPPLPDHAGRRRDAGGHHLICSSSCPRASSPARTPASFSGYTEAPQDISFDAMTRAAGQGGRRAGRGSEHRRLLFHIGTGGPTTSGNTGRLFIRLKPRDERRLTPEQVIESCAQAERDSRHPHLSAEPAAGAHRRADQPQPLSVHPARARHPGTVRLSARISKSACAPCRACSTSTATCRSRARW